MGMVFVKGLLDTGFLGFRVENFASQGVVLLLLLLLLLLLRTITIAIAITITIFVRACLLAEALRRIAKIPHRP